MEQSLVNNYKIEDYLGSGGFSEVWLGLDINTNEKAALKIIEKKLASNQKFRERFRHSAEVLKQLRHENIVKFNELIDLPDYLALVMEYIDGANLEDFILKNYDPASPLKLMPFFLQILDALEYSHQNKIIHRDIKPSNILINRNLVAKLIDFDTIKDFSHDANFTSKNFTIGTFTYISPEQLEDARNVSPQSDIYSMGMVLFYILLGKPFFDKSQKQSVKELATRIISENLPKLSLLNRNIPPVFDAILLKATEKNASNRFKSCAEFKRHLIGQLNPYGIEEEIDLDRTQINFNTKKRDSPPPVEEEKTVINPVPDETITGRMDFFDNEKTFNDRTQFFDSNDRTQFFDNDKTSFNDNYSDVNSDKTAFFENENTAIFRDREYVNEDASPQFVNKKKSEDTGKEPEKTTGPHKKSKLSLSIVDIVILVAGIIMFIVGMFFLYAKLNK